MFSRIIVLATIFTIAIMAIHLTTCENVNDLANDDEDGQTKSTSPSRIFKGRESEGEKAWRIIIDFVDNTGSCMVHKCDYDKVKFDRLKKLVAGILLLKMAEVGLSPEAKKEVKEEEKVLKEELSRTCCCGISDCEADEKDLEAMMEKECKCTNWGLIIGISVGVILLIIIVAIAVVLLLVFVVLKKKKPSE